MDTHSVANAANTTAKEVGSTAKELGEQAASVADRVRSTAADAAQAASRQADVVRRQASEWYDRVSEDANLDRLGSLVQERPLLAIAIAAGVGFILAQLVMPSRR